MTIRGRVRQTVQALFAWIRPVDDTVAEAFLTPDEFALFMRMGRSDRQHHLRVFSRLQAQGHTHPALLTAALLHDVGKTRSTFTIPHRIAAVLVKKFAPAYFEQWSQGEPASWRTAFVVSAQHPVWSAEMMEAVRSDPLSIWLVRHHQDKIYPHNETAARLLEQLQAADDKS